MTDYSKNVDYAAKDALATGDAAKLVLGTEIGAELDELVTAVASKYDASDIATVAEAQALSSNTTLITPSRLGAVLTGAGGSGAGIGGDIIGLTDPGADRILFWDDSADAGAFLTASTGLQIIGTNLSTKDSEIVHNSLSGYDANRHIDHTAVTLSGGGGITGGGTIAANRTLTLDVTSLTADASPDTAADYMLTYDASAAANKKVLLSTLVGVALGDGSWYLSAPQAFTPLIEATVICDTAEYNVLTRGTYSTSTGIYTAGSSGARVSIQALALSTSHAPGAYFSMSIYQNATLKAYTIQRNDANSIAEALPLVLALNLNLAATDTITVKLASSTAATAQATYTRLSIAELA